MKFVFRYSGILALIVDSFKILFELLKLFINV